MHSRLDIDHVVDPYSIITLSYGKRRLLAREKQTFRTPSKPNLTQLITSSKLRNLPNFMWIVLEVACPRVGH